MEDFIRPSEMFYFRPPTRGTSRLRSIFGSESAIHFSALYLAAMQLLFRYPKTLQFPTNFFIDWVAQTWYFYAQSQGRKTADCFWELIMTVELTALIVTAASIGFFHTLLGPDHYLPFIMMSLARKWSASKTGMITFLCGLGHIGSSVVLGLIGVSLGLAVKKLEIVESIRGNLAAWLLIAFGLAYSMWGLRKAYRQQRHSHSHTHNTGGLHTPTHTL